MTPDPSSISAQLKNVLEETNLPFLGDRKTGKVRDIYEANEKLFLISTDRYSAFDLNLTTIPFKGQILTQTSKFWFEQTKDIIPNHALSFPDPNVTVASKCSVLPVEVIVRGYITGVTGTSLWTHYSNGQRNFGETTLKEGLKKNQKLDRPVITPTTKFEAHDRPLTAKEIVETGMIDDSTWSHVEDIAIRLFNRGQEVALRHGLILVDTKYEFGISHDGELTLIDEVHTPDSSRYWQSESYDSRFANGLEPEYFDKEFLRLWYKERCDPYSDKILPKAPDDMRVELAGRYIKIYEQLTGNTFEPDISRPISERIRQNIELYCNN